VRFTESRETGYSEGEAVETVELGPDTLRPFNGGTSAVLPWQKRAASQSETTMRPGIFQK